MSTEIENFNSNGSFFNFYPDFLKTFTVIHKMRKKIKPILETSTFLITGIKNLQVKSTIL